MLITCGGCGKRLNVEDQLAGELGRCPACNAVIEIPKAEGPPNRTPNDPVPKAPVARDPKLLSAASADERGEGDSPRFSGSSATTTSLGGLNGIETDEEGFVLAIPVEDEQGDQPPTTPTRAPGRGVSVPRPAGGEADRGYALLDEGERVPESAASPAEMKGDDGDLTVSLEEVLSQLDSEEGRRVPAADAGASGAGRSADDKIVTRCPGCEGLLAIEAQYAGKMRTCPKCAAEVQVPFASTVVLPAAGAGRRAGAAGQSSAVPSALAENLSPEVDLESYVAGRVTAPTRVVASYWVVLAFVVGATIGFAVGWILAGFDSRPGPPAVEPSPPAKVGQAET